MRLPEAIVISAVVIAAAIYAVGTAGTNAEPKTEFAQQAVFVTRVIDGDTLVAAGEHIRLLGMDADERGRSCYAAAKARLEELVLEKDVTLERDRDDRDQYGRLLRYIHLENENATINVNLRLVEEGLAIARFYDNVLYKEEIVSAERTAREAGVGCKWGRG